MELRYRNTKTKELCTSLKAARKFFGGNNLLAQSLHARINALMQAENLKDIIVQVHFRFHSLQGERSGTFAIDVKSHKDPWRLIIRPLNKNEEPYIGQGIDEICEIVEIVMVEEVSKHYE